MDTIFMNLRNSKTSEPHMSVLNLADRINSKRRVINILDYQISVSTIHRKI